MNQPEPQYIFEGLDPPTNEFGKWSEAVKSVFTTVQSAFERANEPGKPLATVANLTRQEPLGALFIAFIAGVAFATRRVNPRR